MHSGCDRRSFIRLLGLSMSIPLLGARTASAADGPRRIGLLVGAEFTSLVAAVKEELRRLGHIEGENLIVVRVTGSNSDAFAAELTQAGLELVVAGSLGSALAVRKAGSTVPMVIATCPGMVSNGFAKSLERPGGNVTGMDELPPGVTAKRLTLLKTAAPNVSRIALLSTTPGRGGHEAQLADAEQTASALGVTVKPYRVTSFGELEAALAALVNDGMNGLLNFQGALSLINRKLIVDFAVKHRLPAVYQATLFAEAGGLLSWAPDLPEQFRAAARYVDQILRGAKPGDLPIQYPSRYYLTVNIRAAESIGVALPPALLSQADRVIT